MKYITDKKLEEIPIFDGLDEALRTQVIEDGELLYKYVTRYPWVEDEQLRKYASGKGLGPDRVNSGLAFLTQTGQLFGFGGTEVVVEPEEA